MHAKSNEVVRIKLLHFLDLASCNCSLDIISLHIEVYYNDQKQKRPKIHFIHNFISSLIPSSSSSSSSSPFTSRSNIEPHMLYLLRFLLLNLPTFSVQGSIRHWHIVLTRNKTKQKQCRHSLTTNQTKTEGKHHRKRW